MIEQRQLIKEIPKNKFHSAVMTSFSINLHYWDMQLSRSLKSKEIYYVSALVDSDCLSDQLLHFSDGLTRNKPLDYCIHGYKMKGAFHPKIQFYAGRRSVLVLIGSGNLTMLGHGKNLEVWSPIMVDGIESPSCPFIRDVWDYLKSLYEDLGSEAKKFITTVEDNCDLLKQQYIGTDIEHEVGGYSIRFFSNQDKTKSIFSQCAEWIGNDQIKTITIMSPFYDERAQLIRSLNEKYRPQKFRIIVESGFGTIPQANNIPDNVEIYQWDKIVSQATTAFQKFYHSKCFFFEGVESNYMLCGSANASVAAFGIPGAYPSNHEACVGYKSTIDYFQQTGFILNNPINKKDIPQNVKIDTSLGKQSQAKVWIKEASFLNDNYRLLIKNETGQSLKVTIIFYSSEREVIHNEDVVIKKDVTLLSGSFTSIFNPLYVVFVDLNKDVISNRQFVISSERMDLNNPSPEYEFKRKIYSKIESGEFVNSTLLDFISTILNDEKPKNFKRGNKQGTKDLSVVTEEHKFSSIEEFYRDNNIGESQDASIGRGIGAYSQSSSLMNSIISYIVKSAKEIEEEKMDEEETEDVRTSQGKKPSKKETIASYKREESDKLGQKIIRMFMKYIEQLECIALPVKNKKNNVRISDCLKKYMTAVFFLYRTFSYRYVIKGGDCCECSLIRLNHKEGYYLSATEFFYRITPLFARYMERSNLLKETSVVAERDIQKFKQYAFELAIAVYSICDWQNEGNPDYSSLKASYKVASLLNLQRVLDGKIDSSTSNKVFNCLDRSLQEMEDFDKATMMSYINSNIDAINKNIEDMLFPNGNMLDTKEFGYVQLKKRKDDMYYMLTMIYPQHEKYREYCPNYLYVKSKGEWKIFPVLR